MASFCSSIALDDSVPKLVSEMSVCWESQCQASFSVEKDQAFCRPYLHESPSSFIKSASGEMQNRASRKPHLSFCVKDREVYQGVSHAEQSLEPSAWWLSLVISVSAACTLPLYLQCHSFPVAWPVTNTDVLPRSWLYMPAMSLEFFSLAAKPPCYSHAQCRSKRNHIEEVLPPTL